MKLLNRLIDQAKNPNGFVGSIMLSIMNAAHSGMNKWAIGKIKLRKDAIMLDIGCGGGKTIHFFSKINQSGKLYGIDYSEQAVKDSIKLNIENVKAERVSISQASVTNIPFSDNFFDLVTAFQTHYFWEDLEKSVNEVFRVLKPNGQFLIVAELYKINYHMTAYKTKDELEQLFIKTGFQTIEFFENKNRGWFCFKGIK
jgi:ubiquinone/menaquinone biosynthesis C-methylase UbiE